MRRFLQAVRRILTRGAAVTTSGDPARFGESRHALAISRIREQAAERALQSSVDRADELEAELSRTYSELLELRALESIGRRRDENLTRVSELHELFAEIVRRNGSGESLVTVVIPIYGKLDYTLRCLRSIATTWSDGINPTIVIVDDQSPDGSASRLVGIPNVELLCNHKNLGFLRSSNRGFALAETKYTCFLNNDTEVRNGWLDWLVATAEEDGKIGAVGSKLIYPDGTLQDSGSIIWSDATGWNVGRGGDPEASEYNYRREVDYCSGASLLVPTELLRQIGGFDERYAPAYYEDADLCFEVRARGLKVVYEPRSEVIHYEGVTSGTDISTGAKRYQEINRPKFAAKWHRELQSHFAPSADNVKAAMQRTPMGNTVLIIDSYVPMFDREAGSNRLFKIITILRELGYHVAFMPDNYDGVEPYTRALLGLGVEVLHYRPQGPSQERALASALRRADLVWVCRPELCEKYIAAIREVPGLPVIYDTIDLHFVRERRRAELEGLGDEKWRSLRELELRLAASVDAVVTVTESERDELRLNGIGRVFVVPTIHDPEAGAEIGFGGRRGIVFIGGYGHTPNVDAVQWLCTEIMPRVWERFPRVPVMLLGNNPPESVRSLASDLVTVPGFIADVSSYFEEARIFVAPLRYGAGMKGKVGQALSFGLPIVTTTVGAEGFNFANRSNCLIADDAESFADAICEVYDDPALWHTLSSGSLDVLVPLGSEAVRETLGAMVAKIIAGVRDDAEAETLQRGSPPQETIPKKTLIIYGNCQADALGVLLGADPLVSSLFRVLYLPSFLSRESSTAVMDKADVESAAILVEQFDPKPFPYHSLLPETCKKLTFPAVDFNLLWPLHCPNPYNDPPTPEYPWGHVPYGDRVIIDCVDRGMPAEEILEHYLSKSDYLPNLDHLHRIELGRLSARDAKCDVKMAGYLFEQYRTRRLFWCVNHPALPTLCELARRVLDALGEEFPELQTFDVDRMLAAFNPAGPLGFIRVPIHPAVAKKFDITWIDFDGSPRLYGFDAQLVSYEEYFWDMIERAVAQRVSQDLGRRLAIGSR